MGSSATSPNISPSHLSSPNKTPDIYHNFCDQSLTASQHDILESTMNSKKINNDSKISNISGFQSLTTTQNLPRVIDRKLLCRNNSQSATATSDSSSNSNSKFESSSTSFALSSCTKDSIQDKAKDEDKYPCLRRALSCNETPILPLGTYALEFGFDVCSLPFKPNKDSVPKTSTCVNDCPSPSLNLSNEDVCCSAKDTSPKKLSFCQCETSKIVCNLETAISNNTKHHVSQKTNANELNKCIDTTICELSLPKRQKRESVNKTANDQNKDKIKAQMQENLIDTGDENQRSHYNTGEKHSLLNKLQISSNNMDDVELDSKTKNVFEESYWYATKWKKDNRKWLWKCSRRTRPEILACNAMSKRQKKEDSIWSMKPA